MRLTGKAGSCGGGRCGKVRFSQLCSTTSSIRLQVTVEGLDGAEEGVLEGYGGADGRLARSGDLLADALVDGFGELKEQLLARFANVGTEERADGGHQAGVNAGVSSWVHWVTSSGGVHSVQCSADHFIDGVDVVDVEFAWCTNVSTGTIGNGVQTVEGVVEGTALSTAAANGTKIEAGGDAVH
mgnify:CR=1 FL=1